MTWRKILIKLKRTNLSSFQGIPFMSHTDVPSGTLTVRSCPLSPLILLFWLDTPSSPFSFNTLQLPPPPRALGCKSLILKKKTIHMCARIRSTLWIFHFYNFKISLKPTLTSTQVIPIKYTLGSKTSVGIFCLRQFSQSF